MEFNWKRNESPKAKEYREYCYNDPRWQALRRIVLKRANYACEWCKVKEPLHIAHLDPEYKCRGKETPEDVAAICEKCHFKYDERIFNKRTGYEDVERLLDE